MYHGGFSDHPPAVPSGSIAGALSEGGSPVDIGPSRWRSIIDHVNACLQFSLEACTTTRSMVILPFLQYC